MWPRKYYHLLATLPWQLPFFCHFWPLLWHIFVFGMDFYFNLHTQWPSMEPLLLHVHQKWHYYDTTIIPLLQVDEAFVGVLAHLGKAVAGVLVTPWWSLCWCLAHLDVAVAGVYGHIWMKLLLVFGTPGWSLYWWFGPPGLYCCYWCFGTIGWSICWCFGTPGWSCYWCLWAHLDEAVTGVWHNWMKPFLVFLAHLGWSLFWINVLVNFCQKHLSYDS